MNLFKLLHNDWIGSDWNRWKFFVCFIVQVSWHAAYVDGSLIFKKECVQFRYELTEFLQEPFLTFLYHSSMVGYVL